MSIESPQSGMHSVLLFEKNLIQKNTHFKLVSQDSRYYLKFFQRMIYPAKLMGNFFLLRKGRNWRT